MDKVINLGFVQMLSAYLFILILLIIVRVKGIRREQEIVLTTVRMTIQLMMVGYVLAYVINNSNPFFTIIIITIMESFAIRNTFKRVKVKLSPKIKKIVIFSITAGTLVSIIYFILVVIRLSPWYDPRYFITIAGMIIGNSMTGVSLAANRLVDGMDSQRHLIETALMLGATPKMAAKEIVNNAFDSAILPTINSMVGMGIVSLPGMMTGQILSGSSPLLATHYQIAIMLGILGSVSLSVVLFVQLGYMTFFTNRCQLED